MICALLAVLELVRLQAVALSQGELFGAISLRKHKMFDTVFSGGNPAADIDAELSGKAPEETAGNAENA